MEEGTLEPMNSSVTKTGAETNIESDINDVPANPLRIGMAAAWMLAKREWVRFFRQRNRVTAAVAQPLLFWILFGTGLDGAFQSAGELNFMQFFLPGTLALILLFTAIFSTISVIEDRREGFMQAVLVAPVGRWPVLVGKIIGGSAIAWVQAAFFLGLVWIVGTADPGGAILPLLGLMAVVALAVLAGATPTLGPLALVAAAHRPAAGSLHALAAAGAIRW